VTAVFVVSVGPGTREEAVIIEIDQNMTIIITYTISICTYSLVKVGKLGGEEATKNYSCHETSLLQHLRVLDGRQ
jgi:hypothetical protein